MRQLSEQLRQKLLSWSDHVLSWVDASDIRVFVMRYEDMKHKPLETFASVARFAGLSDDPEQVCRAVEFSSFQSLQQQEREHGFREKSPRNKVFFRRGGSDYCHEVLTEKQVNRILEASGEVMRRFGYLTDVDSPVYYESNLRSCDNR